MSAIPEVSRFWTAPTTNGTFLLTWQDFALGRIPAQAIISSLVPHSSSLVSAQLELCGNGDFIARSNNVESVYRRINPDDWDDDGWGNYEDSSPYEADEDGFGPHQDLSFVVHSNNYYWVDLVVSNANALVKFESELPSDLPDPQFIARAGATNRVVLLLGKPYEVKCAQPIVCVGTSLSDVEVAYYVNGGTNGGTYAFTLVNGAKLLQVDGGMLPVTGHVAAAAEFLFLCVGTVSSMLSVDVIGSSSAERQPHTRLAYYSVDKANQFGKITAMEKWSNGES